MKILITGANGMVGQNFFKYLNNDHEVYLTSRRSINLNLTTNFIQCNFLNPDSFKKIKKFVDPDLIIHSGAMTNVDKCQTSQNEAYKINVNASKLLLDLFNDKKIIYISTDAVFGSKNKNLENDEPFPDNYYGLTKYYSEQIIMQNTNNIVIRTTPIGFNYFENSGFLNWILSSILFKKKINVFDDVYFNPIHTSLLLKFLLLTLKKNLKGIFHVNSNFIKSKYEFVKQLSTALKLNSAYINKSNLADSNLIAKRNKNQVLSLKASENILNVKFPNIDDNFLAIAKELNNNKVLRNMFRIND